MEGSSLSSDEFSDWTSRKVIPFLSVMTRIPDREHDALLRDYGGTGFPYLIYMDADGNKLGKPSGRDMDSLVAGGTAAKELIALREKVANGADDLVVDLLLAELQADAVDFQVAKNRRATLQAPRKGARAWKSKIEEIDSLLVGLEINSLLRSARGGSDAKAAAQVRLYEMASNDLLPTKFNRPFWAAVMAEAKERKDLEMFERGYSLHLDFYGENNPRAKRILDPMKADLDELRRIASSQ